MKKIIGVLLILGLTLMSVACGGGSSSSSSSSSSDNQEQIIITGSTSVSAVVTKLAAAFEEANPQYVIRIENITSSVGITDTMNNNNDIGMSSRELKGEELDSVESIAFCNDGIVIIVNNEATLDGINHKDLTDFFMNGATFGSITKPVSREDGSGTRVAFSEITAIAAKESLPSNVEILDSIGKVKSAIANDAAKMGYISLGSIDDSIKALNYASGDSTDYVAPTAENMQNGTYSLFRPFYFIVRKGETLSEGAQSFIDFSKSEAAHPIIYEYGFIPLS